MEPMFPNLGRDLTAPYKPSPFRMGYLHLCVKRCQRIKGRKVWIPESFRAPWDYERGLTPNTWSFPKFSTLLNLVALFKTEVSENVWLGLDGGPVHNFHSPDGLHCKTWQHCIKCCARKLRAKFGTIGPCLLGLGCSGGSRIWRGEGVRQGV